MVEILLIIILALVVVNVALSVWAWRRPLTQRRADDDRAMRELKARRKRREIRKRSG